MTSYQKLKLRCERAETTLNNFKKLLTVYNKPEFTETGMTVSYKIVQNRIDEEVKRELINWFVHNVDKEVLKEWLENDK